MPTTMSMLSLLALVLPVWWQRHLLSIEPTCPLQASFQRISIATALENNPKHQILFVLNGANEGMYMDWNGVDACAPVLTQYAAQQMGLNVSYWRWMSLAGEELETLSDRIVFILTRDELWIWPGVAVGHVQTIQGRTVTTRSLHPKVLEIAQFCTDEEADAFMALGGPKLVRSKVEGNDNDTLTSTRRTSTSAFLQHNAQTQAWQARATQLARLPSDFAETVQVVRYTTGQFYRAHLDTFHRKSFASLLEPTFTFAQYQEWCDWTAQRLRHLAPETLPMAFRRGQALFPNAACNTTFQHALLRNFFHYVEDMQYFDSHHLQAWEIYLQEGLAQERPGLMQDILASSENKMFGMIREAWEVQIQRWGVQYRFPPARNGVAEYLQWIRHVKDQIQRMEASGETVPMTVRGDWAPSFYQWFQWQMVSLLIQQYSPAMLQRLMNLEWYHWMLRHRKQNDVLLHIVQAFPHMVEMVVRAYEHQIQCPKLHYTFPPTVAPFFPNRFATVFVYLNTVKQGGATIFPYSTSPNLPNPQNGTASECTAGLAVSARNCHAALFYAQNANGHFDWWSRHGGCPPENDVKWGSNLFLWNVHAQEGLSTWR